MSHVKVFCSYWCHSKTLLSNPLFHIMTPSLQVCLLIHPDIRSPKISENRASFRCIDLIECHFSLTLSLFLFFALHLSSGSHYFGSPFEREVFEDFFLSCEGDLRANKKQSDMARGLLLAAFILVYS